MLDRIQHLAYHFEDKAGVACLPRGTVLNVSEVVGPLTELFTKIDGNVRVIEVFVGSDYAGSLMKFTEEDLRQPWDEENEDVRVLAVDALQRGELRGWVGLTQGEDGEMLPIAVKNNRYRFRWLSLWLAAGEEFPKKWDAKASGGLVC